MSSSLKADVLAVAGLERLSVIDAISFAGVDILANSNGYIVQCSEKQQKTQELDCCMLNVKVDYSTIRKKLKKYGLFGKDGIFSLKRMI